MDKLIDNYDLERIRGSKYAFNSNRVITFKLIFQDDSFYSEELVRIGGNIVGYDLISFGIDKVLEESNYNLWIPNKDGDNLIVSDSHELEAMLIGFEIISVTLKGESL